MTTMRVLAARVASLAALCAALACAGASAQTTPPPLQFGYIDRFNDPAPHTAARTYHASGAMISLIVEMTDASGNEIAFDQPTMPLTSSRPVRRIVVNWYPLEPCWSVGVASADPALVEVWRDPECQYTHFAITGNQ